MGVTFVCILLLSVVFAYLGASFRLQEWCILSLDASDTGITSGAKSRRQNFFSVASRSSSDHLAYHRDLVMLIKLSMANGEFDLALELGKHVLSCFAPLRL